MDEQGRKMTRLPKDLLHQLMRCELSSKALTTELINNNKAHASLNAIVYERFSHAEEDAAQRDAYIHSHGKPSGLLHGLPITIKECFDLSGTASTFGVSARKRDIPSQNNVYIEALMKSGAVVLGKTNVSQLLSFTETDNPVFGVTLHPKNKKYSCGGSSGGEGALVGAGLSPLGVGTDIGGSIRIPAAVNGCCAIKPTTQRLRDNTRCLPEQDLIPIKSVVGPLSQDASTLHNALTVLNDAVKDEWPVKPLRDYRDIDLSSLKIGYCTDDGAFPVATAVKNGVLNAVAELKAQGAQVIEYALPHLDEAEAIFYGAMSLEKGQFLSQALQGDTPNQNVAMLHKIVPLPHSVITMLYYVLRGLGQKHQSRILKMVGHYTLDNVDELEARLANYVKRVEDSMASTSIGALDAVISPILPVPAYLQNSFKHMGLGGRYSLMHNVTGFPAGIACVGTVKENESNNQFSDIDIAERQANHCMKSAKGLPLSVQIAAPAWREDIVLAVIDALHQPYTQKL